MGLLLQYKKFILQFPLWAQAFCQHASLRSKASKYQKAPTICKDSISRNKCVIPRKWKRRSYILQLIQHCWHSVGMLKQVWRCRKFLTRRSPISLGVAFLFTSNLLEILIYIYVIIWIGISGDKISYSVFLFSISSFCRACYSSPLVCGPWFKDAVLVTDWEGLEEYLSQHYRLNSGWYVT